VLCERTLRSGRVVLALLDPRMQPRWDAHAWRDEPGRGGGLYAAVQSGSGSGSRTCLAEWTARDCVLGSGAAAAGLTVARTAPRDGCPANCLPRNLEIELVPAAAHLGRGEAAALRIAQLGARGALQNLYRLMGPSEGRRFLSDLHREYARNHV
jgi:hypothetical protein